MLWKHIYDCKTVNIVVNNVSKLQSTCTCVQNNCVDLIGNGYIITIMIFNNEINMFQFQHIEIHIEIHLTKSIMVHK